MDCKSYRKMIKLFIMKKTLDKGKSYGDFFKAGNYNF